MATEIHNIRAEFKVTTVKEARALVAMLTAAGARCSVDPYGTWETTPTAKCDDLLFADYYLEVDLGTRGDRATFSHPTSGDTWRVWLGENTPGERPVFDGYFLISAHG